MSLEDADLATHLLGMCPVQWQRQYDLMENSTLVSTRALLMVLENIESNVELNDKPPSKVKAKGTDSKQKKELSHSRSPPRRPRRAGQRSTVLSARNRGLHTTHNTQHQGVQALQQGQKPQEGRRIAQTQQTSQWNELCPINLY
jgi:hypothetical protein